MNFTQYFLNGLKGTLRFNNGKNLSYKGPWVQVLSQTVIDEFYVGDFMAAEYTFCVDGGNLLKESIKCLVVAGPENANLTPFGRTNLGLDLVSISATVDSSRVKIIVDPLVGPGQIVDNGNVLSETGIIKMFFSANYYYSINELEGLS